MNSTWEAAWRHLKLDGVQKIVAGQVRDGKHRDPLPRRPGNESRGWRRVRGIVGDGYVGRVYRIGYTVRGEGDRRTRKINRQRRRKLAGVKARQAEDAIEPDVVASGDGVPLKFELIAHGVTAPAGRAASNKQKIQAELSLRNKDGNFINLSVTSGMRTRASREGDRPIDFLECGVVIFFVFIFVEVGLLNCINCNPVPRGTRNHPHEALRKAASLRLTRGSSWIWRSR